MSERSHFTGGNASVDAPSPRDPTPPPAAGQLAVELHGLALDLQLRSQPHLQPQLQQPAAAGAPGAPPAPPGAAPGAHPITSPAGPTREPPASAASPSSDQPASCPSRVWIPEIVDRVASFLPPNEISASVRLVNRATAGQFRRNRRHVTIVATEPVPAHAFKRQWGHPGGGAAVRALSRGSRQLLAAATAHSGVLENLQALLAWEQYFPLSGNIMAHAAAGGHVGVCEWLRAEAGCPLADHGLQDVVWRGDEAMAMWLIRAGYHYLEDAGPSGDAGGVPSLGFHDDTNEECFTLPSEAARGGHLQLMERLCQLQPEDATDGGELVRGAAEGLPLAALREVYGKWIERRRRSMDRFQGRLLVSTIALSPTPDWAEKLEWLLYEKKYKCFADNPGRARADANNIAAQEEAAFFAWIADQRGLRVEAQSPAPGGFTAPHLFCPRVADVGARLRALNAWPGSGSRSGSGSGFGFGLSGDHLVLAAERGDADLMRYVLDVVGRAPLRGTHGAFRAARTAARKGHLGCLQALLAAGCLPGATAQAAAAAAAAEAVVEDAAPAAAAGGGGGGGGGGSGVNLDEAHDVLVAAASSGRLEVLTWVAAAQGVDEAVEGVVAAHPAHQAAAVAAPEAAAAVAAAAAGLLGAGAAAVAGAGRVAAAAGPAAGAGGKAAAARRKRQSRLLSLAVSEAAAGSGGRGRGEAVALLTWLRSRGCPWGPDVVACAISSEDRELCEWLVAQGCPMDGGAYRAAAGLLTGAVEAAAWAHRHGAPLSADVFAAVAAEQSEGLLTWLASVGCPMPADGSPYLRPALDGDWPTLRCLRRLGCSFGAAEDGLFAAALVDPADYLGEQDAEADPDYLPQYLCNAPGSAEQGPAGARLSVLKWLVEEGCPLLPAAGQRDSAAPGAAAAAAGAAGAASGERLDQQVAGQEAEAVGEAVAALLQRAECRRPWAPNIHTWLVKHLAQLRLQQHQQH
ncbi:hypothetical protein HXX76_012632 [Chlamydomonas incerta]|uniref:Uncharacterized protein n=1 Tax=Chlamydomonas incerta TaxID=51695 RepID=A0A835VVX8_CHLIN|nr:hypothetical protein HXX76_012632 [Chlamydomonas incerta]|eukprot:KAG2427121.1 hypothetical protein HXX76_012632 [Chlamydomonas incerta]